MVFRWVEAIFEIRQVRDFVEEFDNRRKAGGWRFWAWEGGVLAFALVFVAYFSYGNLSGGPGIVFEADPRTDAIASVEAAESQDEVCARDPFKDACK